MTKDLNTEEKIKHAARMIFVKKGLAGARMQEIADEAGINKALLHYYYRSKDKLFDAVFTELIDEFAPKMVSAMGSDLPLREKVELYAQEVITALSTHPELPIFIFNELRGNPRDLIKKLGIVESGALEVIDKQLKEEAEACRIRPIPVHEFMINMASMCVFPFLGKPMFQGLFGVTDEMFNMFMEMRKQSVPEYIMHAVSLNNEGNEK